MWNFFQTLGALHVHKKKSQTCLFLIYANDIHVFQHQTSYPMSKWRRKRTLVWIYLKFTEFIWIIERWIQCTCVNDQFISSSIYIYYVLTEWLVFWSYCHMHGLHYNCVGRLFDLCIWLKQLELHQQQQHISNSNHCVIEIKQKFACLKKEMKTMWW